MLTPTLDSTVLFTSAIFVSFSIIAVSLPSIRSANCLAVSGGTGNFCVVYWAIACLLISLLAV